jgi:hypothetical protein
MIAGHVVSNYDSLIHFNPTEDKTMGKLTPEEQGRRIAEHEARINERWQEKADNAASLNAAGGLASNMTLRDHFAGEVDGIDAEVDDRYASRFNADEKPPKDDWLAWGKWFAKADATIRYIRADAMLEARKTTGEGEA